MLRLSGNFVYKEHNRGNLYNTIIKSVINDMTFNEDANK